VKGERRKVKGLKIETEKIRRLEGETMDEGRGTMDDE
jgi:hypothetical protein